MSNKDMPHIEVLFEDAHCAAINKPAGLMVHDDGRGAGPFLADWVISTYPEAKSVGEPARSMEGVDLNRAGIIHRLDRETSGVMLIAKTQEGYMHLKQQFHDRTITKKYAAFVWGEMKEEFGTISRPIGRSSGDFRKWSAQRGARGDLRLAETYWTKLASAESTVIEDIDNPKVRLLLAKDVGRFSLIEAEPKTGRTHQIRVHFNAINHPIVGDMLYAPKRPFALGFKRAALHSVSVSFKALNGEQVKIAAPLPADFVNAKKTLGIL